MLGVRPVCNYFRGRMPNGFLRKKMYRLLLDIDLRLTLNVSFNLKHILSNEGVKHDAFFFFLGGGGVGVDYVICVEAS